jgi:hypothetical protein
MIPAGGLGEPLNQRQVWLDQSIGADGWAMTPSGMRGNRSLPGRRGDSRARSWLDRASMEGLFRVGEDEPMPLVAATHHKAP